MMTETLFNYLCKEIICIYKKTNKKDLKKTNYNSKKKQSFYTFFTTKDYP